ncbi:MAG: hypothetical protein PUC83_02805 [Fibrobacter sp.]|nr:hypothetical protein [Fibrobacter sp.]MDD5941559.1 hypothetical protein [Fibrobacter sp.]
MSAPNPNTVHLIAGYDKEIYVKPTIKNPNIIVGDFTYIADSEFESHVTHHYDFIGDKLIIGKFCQIAAGVEFVMNGANHQMNAISTFPFYTLGLENESARSKRHAVQGRHRHWERCVDWAERHHLAWRAYWRRCHHWCKQRRR